LLTSFTDDPEPPETPAPVFAARAVKSALFGTPAYYDEDELENRRKSTDMGSQGSREASKANLNSPTKKQGILLTPGTATARRKTVSFGESVVDNGDKNATGQNGTPKNFPGKFPSPWVPKVEENSKGTRQTALTRTLEAAREEKSKTSAATKSTSPTKTRSQNNAKSIADPDSVVVTSNVIRPRSLGTKASEKLLASPDEDFDGDMTLDLNEPHSQSGRYWKSEYERYHEEAKAEMAKLVKYKQLAKSYAKKKDTEAIDLSEKLKEEQQKVMNMEAQINDLVAQIGERRANGTDDRSPALMSELARQTARAREYKDQVEQFRVALEGRDAQSSFQNIEGSQKQRSQRAADTLFDVSQELKKAREQLAEMGSLRDEMHSLRLSLSAAERGAAKLQDENLRLSRDLAKVSKELEKSEKRRKITEEQSRKQNESFQSLQKDYDNLKESAKSQRREAEHILKKRHDQVADLKKQITLHKASADLPLRKEVKPNNAPAVTGPHMQDEAVVGIAKPKRAVAHIEDLMSFDTPPKPASRRSELRSKLTTFSIPQEGQHGEESLLDQTPRNARPRDQKVEVSARKDEIPPLNNKFPVLDENAWKPINHESSKSTLGSGKSRSSLSEIINSADAGNSPARTESQLTPGFSKRFSSLSLDSPAPMLPSLEPSFGNGPGRDAQTKRVAPSPRPSMFNISTSPTNPSSTQSSTLSARTRVTLPPDRAAAAKARLEEKNAAKKRVHELNNQKENIR
jgi:hypothetical protein